MTVQRAFLTYAGQTYVADVPAGNSLETDTAVTRLIEGIWDQHPKQAFHLLRSRIFTNYPLSLRCRGAITLAAKRVTELSPEAFAAAIPAGGAVHEIRPLGIAPFPVELPGSAPLPPAELARWISGYAFTTSDRPILAAIVDPAGVPLIAAPNSSSSNRLRHAEVNAVRAYVRQHRRKVPAGSALWVSLKPCRMCAGFVHDLFEDGARARVRYLVDDPGPKARNSPLQTMLQYREE